MQPSSRGDLPRPGASRRTSRRSSRRRTAALAAAGIAAACVIPAAAAQASSAQASSVQALSAHAPTPAAARPAQTAGLQKNVTANLFEWNFPSIASECTGVLGPDGYAAVQVAPPQDSLDSSGHSWWDVYQPVDYTVGGRLGTLAQFQSMVASCHAAGVKVYVDAVLNHMAEQPTSGTGISYDGVSYNTTTLSYPAYSSGNFHSYPANCPESSDNIVNWNSYQEVTECRLDGLPDLATETSYVRATEAAYLNTLIGYGVDGFRLDSAKDIGETDIAAIEALLNRDTTTGQPVAISQEVALGSDNTQLEPAAFEPEGSVIGFDFAYELDSAFDGDIASLGSWSPSIPSAAETALVTNQDTERAGTTLDYQDGAKYTLANEFMLAYGYGSPQVYASFDWSGYDQGPPSDANGYVTATSCGSGSGWECTDRVQGVAALVAWHNLAYTDNDAVANWYTDGSNLIAFSRGSDAWIAIDNESSAQTDTFTTGLPDGRYCDIVNDAYTASTGACSGTAITVSGGRATVTVPAFGAVAFDVDAAVSTAGGGSTYTETFNVTVPVNTAASGDPVYLDGNFSVLGEGGSDWAAAGIAMTKVDDTHYTVTVTSAANTTLQYKYDLGGSWNNVEETGACGYVNNRSASIANGVETDTVANWQGPNTCGTAQAVIDVTVPSNTPSTSEVYIAGAFSALGTGMSSSNDWAPGLYPLTKTGANTWQITVAAVPGTTLAYKFDLNGTWTNVEEESGCAMQPNRSFVFNGAGSSYVAADSVVDWAGYGGC